MEERLHQHFNQHVFEAQQKQYASEGLDMSQFAYARNDKTVSMLFLKQSGLLDTLGTVAITPRVTCKQLTDKIHQQFQGNEKYIVPSVRRIAIEAERLMSCDRTKVCSLVSDTLEDQCHTAQAI